MKRMIGLFICILLYTINVSCEQCEFELPRKTVYPTSNNATTIIELVQGLGLIYENYPVVTDDGYILNINRLVHPCRRQEKDKGIPILMVHGLFMHSDGWLLQAVPKDNMAVNWVMEGYDVWLGDQRGSMRSQKHVSLTTKQGKFWDFTIDTVNETIVKYAKKHEQRLHKHENLEMLKFLDNEGEFERFKLFHESGVYDLPAFIDFVLNTTGHPKLAYTALSLGTTFHMVMCSERPEYNAKLYGVIDFVPVGFQPILSSLPPAVQMHFVYMRAAFGTYLQSHSYYVRDVVTIKRNWASICQNFPHAFVWVIDVMLGAGGNFHIKNFCWQFTTMFSGTSVYVVLHTLQLFETANFTRYDYGEEENMRRYGQPEPPGYDLSKVTSPIAFYTSEQDSFSPSHVVDNMLDMFKGPTYHCSVQNFHHLDINFGIQFHRILPDVNELMDSITGRASPDKLKSGACSKNIGKLG